MDDKIIGIEVAGLTYGLKDEETANTAEQAKAKATTATEAAEAASSAVEEQAQKVAQIEANIGDNNISEIASNATDALDSATEANEAAENALAQVDSMTYRKRGIPRFKLENVSATAKGTQATTATPFVVNGYGPAFDSRIPARYYTVDLAFYDDAITVTMLQVYFYISRPTQGTWMGELSFKILLQWLKSELVKAYPDRKEEINNYFEKKVPNLKTVPPKSNGATIIATDEDDTLIINNMSVNGGFQTSGVMSFSATCGYVLATNGGDGWSAIPIETRVESLIIAD